MSFLALKRDIKEGSYGVFEVFKKSYIVKNDGGKFLVAENRCTHRGFKVAHCAGSGTIKCGYHGKRFDFDKLLTHFEFGEILFVPQFLQASTLLSSLGSVLGTEFAEEKFVIEAPFHLWIQNSADTRFMAEAHKGGFSDILDSSTVVDSKIDEFESSVTLNVRDKTFEKYKGVYPGVVPFVTQVIGFPNLAILNVMNLIYTLETIQPISKTESLLHTRYFWHKDVLKPPQSVKAIKEGNAAVLAKRVAVVEKWATNYVYEPNTKWISGEERIKRYADEIRARSLE